VSETPAGTASHGLSFTGLAGVSRAERTVPLASERPVSPVVWRASEGQRAPAEHLLPPDIGGRYQSYNDEPEVLHLPIRAVPLIGQ
jgi:hypothetical protein